MLYEVITFCHDRDRRIDQGTFGLLRTSKNEFKSLGDCKTAATTPGTAHDNLRRNLSRMMQNEPGSKSYWDRELRKLFAIIRGLNRPPTYFITLSFNENHDAFLIKYLHTKNHDLSEHIKKDVFQMTQRDPISVSEYFHRITSYNVCYTKLLR